jgi:hypothetical protein
MKRKLLYLAGMLSICLMSGCFEDEPITAEEVAVWPSEEFVTQIHFVSKLTNAAMGTSEADYAPVSTYFTGTLNSTQGSWLGIVDRTDVAYNGTNQQYAILKSALDSKHWTYLAFNRISGGNTFEASTMLINAPVTASTAYKLAADCYISGPILEMQGVKTTTGANIAYDVYFRTVRFDAQAHINAFGGSDGAMFKMKRERMNFVMVGTVKKDLIASLQTAVNDTDSAFKLSIVEGTENADYAIFVLAEEHFWRYAGSSVTSLGNGINAYTINLNW